MRTDTRGVVRRSAGAACIVLSLLLGAAATAPAKCAMCAKSAEYAGGESGDAAATLLGAALVLLLPVILGCAGLAWLLWKHRHGALDARRDTTLTPSATATCERRLLHEAETASA